VFVIQNTQNRDARAMHLKLNELIASIEGARNRLVDLEELTDEELATLQKQFQQLQRRALAAAPEDCSAVRPDAETPGVDAGRSAGPPADSTAGGG
jgi:low affinity Fe/Cu permease